MTDARPVVPLPERLSKCGCPHAPMRHLTTCAIAIEFDETPLKDRPEYEEGRAFAAISWDYPLRITAKVYVNVELDPIAVIVDHADEYRDFVIDAGYEAWEKPILFLSHLVEEQCDNGGVWFGSRRLSRDTSYLDDMTEFPRWTPEDTDRLNAVLEARPPIHPDQGKFEA